MSSIEPARVMTEPPALRLMWPPRVASSPTVVLLRLTHVDTSASGVPTQAPGSFSPIHSTPAIGPLPNTPRTRRSTTTFWPRSHESRYSGESRSSLMRRSAVTRLLAIESGMSCSPATLSQAPSSM